MKIGIFKPGKTVYFKDNSADYAGWSFEVVKFFYLLKRHGHDVSMLSDNDTYPVVSTDNVFDRVFVFCGVFTDKDKAELDKIYNLSIRIDYIFTDYKLKPHLNMYTDWYTQSPNVYTYCQFEQLVTLDFKFKDTIEESIAKKDDSKYRYYFGGGERGRTNDFFEYVWRPDCTLSGKSTTLGFDNRVGYKEHQSNMKKAKYGIVIADVEYNTVNWLTPRYYENIMNDVISFVDCKYDNAELMIQKDDFRRVSNYLELAEKMNTLDENPVLYRHILEKQRTELTPKMIVGDNIYNHIFKHDS